MEGANNFIGNPSFAINKRGTGIRSYDAGYTVRSSAGTGTVYNPANPPVPNVFNDLSQGIDVYSKGGAASSILIKDNDFNNVYQGITASGSNFSEISFNDFNTPAGDISFYSWAMYLNTSSGFLATENNMNTLGTNDFTFGIVTRDADVVFSEVYKNDFNGDYRSASQVEANLFNYDPQEVDINCNRYPGTNDYDWAIVSENAPLIPQGDCFVGPQRNIFGLCATLDWSQIYSQYTTFLYSSESIAMPDCINPNVLTDLCNPSGQSFEDVCPLKPGIVVPCPSCVVALGQQLDFLPPGLERKKVKGEYVRLLAQDGNVQDLIDFLVNEGDTKDRKVLIPTHLQRKEFTEARNELNLLDQTTYENQKFYDLFDVLTFIGEDGRELDSITVAEKLVIETVANTNTQVSIQAQAVLAELEHGAYIRFPEQIIPTPSALMLNNSNNEIETNKSTNVSVYPNPSEGDVVVEFEKARMCNGELLDATGRLVRSFEMDGNQRFHELTSLSHGLYMLVIHYLDGNVETKRVLIE